MKKTLCAIILALTLVMGVVLAADAIDILQLTIPVSGTGGVATGLFDVQNTGTNPYSVTFGVSILTDGQGNILFVNLPSDIPNLNVGETQAKSFTVNISNATVGIYNGTL